MYTVTHMVNSNVNPQWETKWTKTIKASYPEDIIDRYEYPGQLRLTTYSDGVVEGVWEQFDIDKGTTTRRSLIIERLDS